MTHCLKMEFWGILSILVFSISCTHSSVKKPLLPRETELLQRIQDIATEVGTAKGTKYTGQFASIQRKVSTDCESPKVEDLIVSPFAGRIDIHIDQKDGLLTLSLPDQVFAGPVNKDGTFSLTTYNEEGTGLLYASVEGKFESKDTAKVHVFAEISHPTEKQPVFCFVEGKYDYTRTTLTDFRNRTARRPYVKWHITNGKSHQRMETKIQAELIGETAVIYSAITSEGKSLKISFAERPDTPGRYYGISTLENGQQIPCDFDIESVMKKRLLGTFTCAQTTTKISGNFIAPIPYY